MNEEMTSDSEQSLPIIKVWEGILVVPVIGTLDSTRTESLMEHLLEEIHETKSEVAIIDISGVPTIDTQVSQHILKLGEAIQMLGSHCIMSGVKPEVAQSVVELGVDFSSLNPQPDLSSALEIAFERMGFNTDALKRS